MTEVESLRFMDRGHADSSINLNSKPDLTNMLSFLDRLSSNPSTSLEIRLFFVRITPCITDHVPQKLTLCHACPARGMSVDINGCRVPSEDTYSVSLRCDRVDKEASEITYVSTENIRVSGGVEFELYEEDCMILCGTLERVESSWGNGVESEKSGWVMDCHIAASLTGASSSFFKLGFSPSIEVYIAGCCSGSPVILTKTVPTPSRRKQSKQCRLDSIPEEDVMERQHVNSNSLVLSQNSETGAEDCGKEMEVETSVYSEQMYIDEDGQLSWFNAGVRVGVGIGLGMCVGIGIGIGVLMHSYQAVTRNFRRRFF